MNSPILLSGVITPPGIGATQGLADSSLMQNPFNTPMWIDEVRMRRVSGSGNSLDTHLKLTLGRIPVTHGFVPVGALGKRLAGFTSNGDFDDPLYLTWRLPRPLLIPAGEYLVPMLYAASSASGWRISYAGRSLPKEFAIPPIVQVPYATPFVAATRVDPTDDTTQVSHETDLVNVFDVPLFVQRFVGRLLVDSAWNAYASRELLMLRMYDSIGKILVRDETPFGHVFSELEDSWTVHTQLAPKGFYTATLLENYSLLARGAGAVQAAITLVGHREVDLR